MSDIKTTDTQNPAAWLGLGRDADIEYFLRAAGMDEACITGGASDYDRFLALSEAMAVAPGHAVANRIQKALTAHLGVSAPLSPHTARAYWDAWVDVHWYRTDIAAATRARLSQETCPDCPPVQPTFLFEADVCVMQALMERIMAGGACSDLADLTRLLQDTVPPTGGRMLITLPSDYAFVRPDPYHAAAVLHALASGETVSSAEKNLLWTQILRIWGETLVERGGELFLPGGAARHVAALLDYLHGACRLPPMVWFPAEFADAETVSGRYAGVRIGLVCDPTVLSEDVNERMTALATCFPLGRAVCLSLPDHLFPRKGDEST